MNFDFEVNSVPSQDGLAPILADVLNSQKDQFFQSVFGSKSAFRLGYFSELAVESFNSVCRVNKSSDFVYSAFENPLLSPCTLRLKKRVPRNQHYEGLSIVYFNALFIPLPPNASKSFLFRFAG